jgi:hypothetical protein
MSRYLSVNIYMNITVSLPVNPNVRSEQVQYARRLAWSGGNSLTLSISPFVIIIR